MGALQKGDTVSPHKLMCHSIPLLFLSYSLLLQHVSLSLFLSLLDVINDMRHFNDIGNGEIKHNLTAAAYTGEQQNHGKF